MQPGPPPEYAPAQPAAGWPPPGHRAHPPTPAPASTSEVADPPQSRPGLIVLVAVLVEIIVIAAADNQWVAERVSRAVFEHPQSLGYDLGLALLTFQWRFAPASSDALHTLYGQWELLAVLLVLTAVLVLFVARGAPGFTRVFFGTWTAVIAATGVGAMVRAALVDGRLLRGQSRFQFALFSQIGPAQHVFVGALGLGLLAGLGAGFTSMAARREERPAPVPAVRTGDDAPTAHFERPTPDADATQEYER